MRLAPLPTPSGTEAQEQPFLVPARMLPNGPQQTANVFRQHSAR